MCTQVEAGWLNTSCLEALCESRDNLAAAAVECSDDNQGDIVTVKASYSTLNSSTYVQQRLLTSYTTGGCSWSPATPRVGGRLAHWLAVYFQALAMHNQQRA